MQAEARELLTGLALELDPTQPVGLLSGGQRQAVALGRAIFHQARFAIFDEPTAALGVIETRATLKVIEGFRDRGLGVIVVSHALADIFRVTDRIITMRAGRVVGKLATEMTSPDEILELMMKGDNSDELPAMSI
jgi:ABC-type sugar transport system ATPase subunit